MLALMLDEALVGEKYLHWLPTHAVTKESVSWLAPRVVFAIDESAAWVLNGLGVEHQPLAVDYANPGKWTSVLHDYAWRLV
jgi:hypothetical protein